MIPSGLTVRQDVEFRRLIGIVIFYALVSIQEWDTVVIGMSGIASDNTDMHLLSFTITESMGMLSASITRHLVV